MAGVPEGEVGEAPKQVSEGGSSPGKEQARGQRRANVIASAEARAPA